MNRMGPKVLAPLVIASIAFAACILDLDGLSGGARPLADDGGRTDSATTADATVSETGSETGTDACPGIHGPKAVRVTSGAISFCVDATEVTNANYAEFLATSPPTAGQLSACSDNSTFTPTGNWPGSGPLPVVNVDWCDAYAYCAWAGKALCGKIGGGHLDLTARNDVAQSKWLFACSANGAKTYPYGATFDGAACTTGGSRAEVAAKQTCQGGFPGVFDMSGSVEEWTDECTADFADCVARGGNYSDTKDLECTTDIAKVQPRMLREAWRGFRCCSP